MLAPIPPRSRVAVACTYYSVSFALKLVQVVRLRVCFRKYVPKYISPYINEKVIGETTLSRDFAIPSMSTRPSKNKKRVSGGKEATEESVAAR
jgi:hypothetical protein